MDRESTGHLAPLPPVVRRVAFLGTTDEAATILRALVDSPIEVVLVISQPDRKRGRGSNLVASPVKAAALDLGIEVTDDLEAVASADVDLAVVVAYGRLIPRRLLEQVPMVNIHFSLLPRWRGAAPVERALLAGDETTGVCLMVVAEGLDTGDLHATAELAITEADTAGALREALATTGADLLITSLVDGLSEPTPQKGEPTHAAKLEKDEFKLDFSQSAIDLARRVRVGRAWTTFRDRRLGVTEVAVEPGPDDVEPGTILDEDLLLVSTGDAALALITVKPEGKRTMSARDWANGVQPKKGEQLGL